MKETAINCILSAILLTLLLGCTHLTEPVNDIEALSIAQEGFIYGLPLIYTDLTRLTSKVEINKFQHIHRFPDHTFRTVVRPNNDTYYSSAFLDLRNEPVVLTIPDSKDRYYVVPLYDAWTNVFASFGKRTTGTRAQEYVVTGPDFKGNLPKGSQQVVSPTNLVWIIGRYQVNNPDDGKNFVAPLQEKLLSTPLSEWQKVPLSKEGANKNYSVESLAVIKKLKKGEVGVKEAAKQLSIEDFFNYINELLESNPPLPGDSVIVRRLAKLGIGGGLDFDLSRFNAALQSKLKEIPNLIYAKLDSADLNFNPKKSVSDTTVPVPGRFGTNYKTRAFIAYKGLGALNPEEAIYLNYLTDGDSNILNGKNSYVVHFAKGQTPPARAFWSYTLYDKDGYLIKNPINRYAIGDRDPLVYNADGSLDLYIQNQNPGKNLESNWLPSPNETFNLTVRIYWPSEAYLKDRSSWQLPPLISRN